MPACSIARDSALATGDRSWIGVEIDGVTFPIQECGDDALSLGAIASAGRSLRQTR